MKHEKTAANQNWFTMSYASISMKLIFCVRKRFLKLYVGLKSQRLKLSKNCAVTQKPELKTNFRAHVHLRFTSACSSQDLDSSEEKFSSFNCFGVFFEELDI